MSQDEVFAGKVVQIYVEKPANGGMFENVRTESLGGRDFFVGTLCSHPSWSDSRAGLTYWIAVDAVQMLAIYPDLETAQGCYTQNFERKQDASKPRRHWWQK